jgi:hypothetical protein
MGHISRCFERLINRQALPRPGFRATSILTTHLSLPTTSIFHAIIRSCDRGLGPGKALMTQRSVSGSLMIVVILFHREGGFVNSTSSD